MLSCFKPNNVDEAETVANLMRNGGMLLKESISFNNGRANPIRSFSMEELRIATHNYDESKVFREDGFSVMYNGNLHERLVIVKKIKKHLKRGLQYAIREIVFASTMSKHKNVLKLLGCCLESRVPILVFEFAEQGTLHDYLLKIHRNNNDTVLLWRNRLKIAANVANAIAHFHTAFPRPAVHRHITAHSIFLDEDFVAKVTNFSLSMSIPEGETHIEDLIIGTTGYLDPGYYNSGRFNEKTDVFSFGVVLLELLTGREPIIQSQTTEDRYHVIEFVNTKIQDGQYEEMVDPTIVDEKSWPNKDHQLKTLAELALQCTCYNEQDRPEITDVAKQLLHLYQSLIS